jgi:6-phosphofructokinase
MNEKKCTCGDTESQHYEDKCVVCGCKEFEEGAVTVGITKALQEIDLSKIRGHWQEATLDGYIVAGGDDTVASMQLIAEKVNQIIRMINED